MERRHELERLKELLLRCREEGPLTQALVLAELERESPSLAAELRELLAAAERPVPLVDQPVDSEILLEQGTLGQIGAYDLLRPLGAGAMAVVWLARQKAAPHRLVALKLLDAEHGHPSFVARFHAEREALQRVQHPAIAKLLDAGTDREGRPFIAMEYVEGVPITSWVAEAAPAVSEILAVIAEACHGVQHAHERGLIHRDLKPANLLIQRRHGRAEPRIIDFGVAKALSGAPGLTEDRLTASDEIVGTIEYMSPEQADPRIREVSVGTDVHALGVILYECLTGSLPISSEKLRAGSLRQAVELLQSAPIAPPSRRNPRLGRAKELDAIVMMALEREAHRRYRRPEDLAQDLERLLSGQAVSARMSDFSYRLRKGLWRHRWAVALALVLVGSGVGFLKTTMQHLDAQRAASELLTAERDRAVRAMEESERARNDAQRDRDAAMRSQDESDAFAHYVREVVWRYRPGPPGAETSMLDLLRTGADEFLANPHPQIAVRGRIAQVYIEPLQLAGDLVRAESLGKVALEAYRAVAAERGGQFHADHAWAAKFLGAIAAARGDLNEALALREEALAASVRTGHDAMVANSLMHLADSAAASGDDELHLELADRAERLTFRATTDTERRTDASISTLRALFALHRHGDVLKALPPVLEARAQLGLPMDELLFEARLFGVGSALAAADLALAQNLLDAMAASDLFQAREPLRRLHRGASARLDARRGDPLEAARSLQAQARAWRASVGPALQTGWMSERWTVEALCIAKAFEEARRESERMLAEVAGMNLWSRAQLSFDFADWLAREGDFEGAEALIQALLVAAKDAPPPMQERLKASLERRLKAWPEPAQSARAAPWLERVQRIFAPAL